jgi:hypothetical protein
VRHTSGKTTLRGFLAIKQAAGTRVQFRAWSFLIWFATCQSLTVIGRAVTFLGFSPLLKRAGRVSNRGAAPCPANCAKKRNKKGEKDEECD